MKFLGFLQVCWVGWQLHAVSAGTNRPTSSTNVHLGIHVGATASMSASNLVSVICTRCFALSCTRAPISGQSTRCWSKQMFQPALPSSTTLTKQDIELLCPLHSLDELWSCDDSMKLLRHDRNFVSFVAMLVFKPLSNCCGVLSALASLSDCQVSH